MVVGLGIDLVEIDRIARVIHDQPRFTARILTPKERQTITNPTRIAGRWAAKEAVMKALPQQLSLQQIEITNDAQGHPTVSVSHPDFDAASYRITISITHERTHAAAVAVLEKI
jgi:holo-[acyl-carrier protein] synthase